MDNRPWYKRIFGDAPETTTDAKTAGVKVVKLTRPETNEELKQQLEDIREKAAMNQVRFTEQANSTYEELERLRQKREDQLTDAGNAACLMNQLTKMLK